MRVQALFSTSGVGERYAGGETGKRPSEGVNVSVKSSASDRSAEQSAVLPIAADRVVIRQLEEFPGRENHRDDAGRPGFVAENKYRHTWRDEKGELQSRPLGTYWISSPSADSSMEVWHSCRSPTGMSAND